MEQLFLDYLKTLDDRSISDAARHFAAHEVKSTLAPENIGERTAELEIAFEAGRIFERHFRTSDMDY